MEWYNVIIGLVGIVVLKGALNIHTQSYNIVELLLSFLGMIMIGQFFMLLNNVIGLHLGTFEPQIRIVFASAVTIFIYRAMLKRFNPDSE